MATGVSAVKIGNLALSMIGVKSTIESFSDPTAPAQEISLWYEFAKEQALKSHDWSFARKRVALAVHGDDAPETDWAFRYAYPSDCIAARKIDNPLGWTANAVPFHVETSDDGTEKTILTDAEDAILVYTRNVDDTSLFSPHFVLTLAATLGAFIAFPLTAKQSVRDSARDEALTLQRLAPAMDANEGVERGPRDAEWIRER